MVSDYDIDNYITYKNSYKGVKRDMRVFPSLIIVSLENRLKGCDVDQNELADIEKGLKFYNSVQRVIDILDD
jgi:hypothetical protein